MVGAHVQGMFLSVERIPVEGETVLGSSFDEPRDGGKTTNQAVAAVRLGAPTAVVTAVGDDSRGQSALDYFRGEGIDVRHVHVMAGETDVGVILLPPSRVPAIVTVLDRNRQFDRTVVQSAAETIASASVVVCALEASQDAVICAFELARSGGAFTILNPAPAAQLSSELTSLTDLLVPNHSEAEYLADEEGDATMLAERLAQAFDTDIVVTAGERGAILVQRGERPMHIPAPCISVVDSTGAGDGFIGALAAKARETRDLRHAVAYAVRAASFSVTRPGTMPSYPTALELAEWSLIASEDPDG
jgi:ribokinase